MRTLTIDPGMHTGWALWIDGGLAEWGQITVKHKTLEADLRYAFSEFRDLVHGLRPDQVFIEYPGVWGSSATSMASALSGDLIKLATMVGGFCSLCYPARFHLIPPMHWKGQLNKEAVKLRVKRATQVDERSSHINDAIGIGLHIYGRFQQRNPVRPFQR